MSPSGYSFNMDSSTQSFASRGVIFQPDGQPETTSMKQVPRRSAWSRKARSIAFSSRRAAATVWTAWRVT